MWILQLNNNDSIACSRGKNLTQWYSMRVLYSPSTDLPFFFGIFWWYPWLLYYIGNCCHHGYFPQFVLFYNCLKLMSHKKNYLNEWYTVFFQLLELIYYNFFNFIELIYISIFILIRLLQKGLCIFHTIWFSALQLKHCIIAVIMCDVAPLLGCFALCIIVYISLSLSLSLFHTSF
jgi:hypothetical protein